VAECHGAPSVLLLEVVRTESYPSYLLSEGKEEVYAAHPTDVRLLHVLLLTCLVFCVEHLITSNAPTRLAPFRIISVATRFVVRLVLFGVGEWFPTDNAGGLSVGHQDPLPAVVCFRLNSANKSAEASINSFASCVRCSAVLAAFTTALYAMSHASMAA